MSKSYVIQWKSKVNGRAGKGTKVFDFEQAHRLAEELNSEYPDIHHEPMEIGLAAEPGPVNEPAAATTEMPMETSAEVVLAA